MNTLFLKKIDQIVGKILVKLISPPVVRPVDFSSSTQILFIRPGGIGDAVLLIPAIQSLKKAYPHCQIDILAEKRNAQIFLLCQEICHVYRYDNSSEFLTVFRTQYDVVIDTEQWHRLSAIVARFIKSKSKIGFGTNERSKMFTTIVPYLHDDYEAKSFLNLLQPLKIDPLLSSNGSFLEVPSAVKSASELLGADIGRYIVLFPGASIQERRWGIDHFSALAGKLVEQKLDVVIVGGDEDRLTGEIILESVPSAINLAGKTSLLETASILKGATLLISGDSGVLHIGVGVGASTVSLFGPGIAAKWAPRGENHRVLNLGFTCSPCTKFGTTPACPIGGGCIQDISVDKVFDAACELLDK